MKLFMRSLAIMMVIAVACTKEDSPVSGGQTIKGPVSYIALRDVELIARVKMWQGQRKLPQLPTKSTLNLDLPDFDYEHLSLVTLEGMVEKVVVACAKSNCTRSLPAYGIGYYLKNREITGELIYKLERLSNDIMRISYLSEEGAMLILEIDSTRRMVTTEFSDIGLLCRDGCNRETWGERVLYGLSDRYANHEWDQFLSAIQSEYVPQVAGALGIVYTE